MDPNEALEKILELADAVLDDEGEFYPDNLGADAVQLAEAVQGLHTWITKGGFLPTAWAEKGRIRTVSDANYLPSPGRREVPWKPEMS